MRKKPKKLDKHPFPMVEMAKDTPWFDVEGHEKYPRGKFPKYSGELSAPIIKSLSGAPVIDGAAVIDDIMEDILRQRIDKLILLLKHYKIERTTDPWLFLSLRLACAFVPGLMVLPESPKKPGRPPIWKGKAGDDLIAAVDNERAESGQATARSIANLKRKDPIRWQGLNEARYYEARREADQRRQAIDAHLKAKTNFD